MSCNQGRRSGRKQPQGDSSVQGSSTSSRRNTGPIRSAGQYASRIRSLSCATGLWSSGIQSRLQSYPCLRADDASNGLWSAGAWMGYASSANAAAADAAATGRPGSLQVLSGVDEFERWYLPELWRTSVDRDKQFFSVGQAVVDTRPTPAIIRTAPVAE
jgi:hypothetical protein